MRNRAVAVRRDESICEDGLLRPWPDAARFLGVSRSAIYRLIQTGELPYVRVLAGGDRRIPKKSLVAFADDRLVERAR